MVPQPVMPRDLILTARDQQEMCLQSNLRLQSEQESPWQHGLLGDVLWLVHSGLHNPNGEHLPLLCAWLGCVWGDGHKKWCIVCLDFSSGPLRFSQIVCFVSIAYVINTLSLSPEGTQNGLCCCPLHFTFTTTLQGKARLRGFNWPKVT